CILCPVTISFVTGSTVSCGCSALAHAGGQCRGRARFVDWNNLPQKCHRRLLGWLGMKRAWRLSLKTVCEWSAQMVNETIEGTFRQTNLTNQTTDYLSKREELRLAEIELMRHRE